MRREGSLRRRGVLPGFGLVLACVIVWGAAAAFPAAGSRYGVERRASPGEVRSVSWSVAGIRWDDLSVGSAAPRVDRRAPVAPADSATASRWAT
jgi:hypothetical protein